MANSQSSTKERIYQEYHEKAIIFKNEVAKLGDEIKGIPAPHIPIAGKNYDLAKYKIAFVGMETAGWEDLDHFIEEMETNPSNAILACQDWLDPKLILKRNGNATFFGFIIRFLELFYKIDRKTITNKENLHPALTSFVWAETNSIERYHVTAAKNKVNKEVWEQVKKLSKPLDSINHLINATNPKVVIITDKWVCTDYILREENIHESVPESKESKKYAYSHQPDEKIPYQYYYLRDNDTHVFVIPHPRWIGLHKQTDAYIDSIISVIDTYKIWQSLPNEEADWIEKKNKALSTIDRYKFIADLSEFLVSHNMTLTGIQLAELLNAKGFRTKYGTKYKTISSRAMLSKIVEPAWNYFYKNKKYQIALNISKAFTDKNGNLAWEK